MDSSFLPRIPALILAAGFSSRMGALKPLLQLGDKTVLETVVDHFLQAGIEDVYVVVGYRHDSIKRILNGKDGVHWVHHASYAQGMFSSIQAGVRAMPESAFLLTPVDIPLFTSATVCALVEAYERHNRVIYPMYDKKRGHPIVVPAYLREAILMQSPANGLRDILHGQPHDTIVVPDAGILYDMDTPVAYEAMKKRFISYADCMGCDK